VTALLPVFILAVAAASSLQEVSPEIEARLRALSPRDPEAYLILGEDVADAAQTPGETVLAKQLFGLAGALAPVQFGRSAALALADMEADPALAARYHVLAELLTVDQTSRPLRDEQEERGDGSLSVSAVIGVARALSHYRNGQGSEALAQLENENVRALFVTYATFIPGGVARFEEDCRRYRSRQRPSLTDRERYRLWRLELALLSGGQASLADDLLRRRGEPLAEVDPANVEESFGVDPSRCLWREGGWQEQEQGAAVESP